MPTYFFKQISRESGEVVGYVSYDGYYPKNDNESILLEEITQEEFEIILNSIEEENNEEGEG